MHKKIRVIFLIVVMLVTMVFGSNTVLAEGGGVTIVECVANDERDIQINQRFNLTFKVLNNESEAIEDVVIKITDNNSFVLVNEAVIDKIEAGVDAPGTIKLLYTGRADTDVTLNISYKVDGKTEKDTHPCSITNIVPDEDSGGGDGGGGGGNPINKADFKPILEITSDDLPEGKAGGTITIPLTLSNIAKYEAREIRITPTLPQGVFMVEQMTVYKTLDRIRAEKSSVVEFKFEIDKYARADIYSIPLTITYKNVYGVEFSELKSIYIKIINENLPPQLVVREGRTNPSIVESGENFSLSFDVWNMGTIEAKNVTVDIEPGDSFFILDNVTKQYLFELKGLNDRKISYSLKAKKDLESGTYPVTIILEHDEAAKTSYTLYVTVEGEEEEEEEEKIDIITENVKTPLEAVETQTPFDISFDVKNIGLTEAKDVKITVDAGDMILPKSLNVLTINTLQPDESMPVSFSFIASKDCENRSYPIKAVIEYKNGDEQVRKEQYMGVLIESEEEKKDILNTVPKIIISEYSSDPGMVKAGENFTLNMEFLNTSKVKSIQNMKITLVVDEGSKETGGSVFTPVQSSNTFYIDKLEPGQTSKKEMVMYTIPDAQAKTYVVKALFEYEYEEDEQLKTNNMEDLFGIPVIQSAKLEVTDVIVSEPAFVGEPVYVSSEFYNTGRVKLSNLMIRVEGDFDTRESNYFVGNFEIGNADYYDASITPLQPGETKGLLVYTFEDAAGEEHRIETEFTVNAMEAEPVMNPFPNDMFPDNPGMYPGMEEQTSKFPLIPVIIGGVVLVGVIVLIIVLKRRKKRKELMLDEDI
jgi:hypothetical protein